MIELADGVIRFTHPLLASVLYQAASPSDRRRAHERLARSSRNHSRAPAIARLLPQEPDGELAGELEAAADVAIARGAPIAAAELGEHALGARRAEREGGSPPARARTARAHLAAGEGARPRAIAGRAPG